MTDISKEAVEWPREIWLAELDDHHNGTGMVVFSEFATVPRWEGDDAEFQKYVDADIYDSAERYHKERNTALSARIAELEARPVTVQEAAKVLLMVENMETIDMCAHKFKLSAPHFFAALRALSETDT